MDSWLQKVYMGFICVNVVMLLKWTDTQSGTLVNGNYNLTGLLKNQQNKMINRTMQFLCMARDDARLY